MPVLYNVRTWRRDSTRIYLCGNGSSSIEVYSSDDQGYTWTLRKQFPNLGYLVRGFGVLAGPTYSDDTFYVWAHKTNDKPRIFFFKPTSSSMDEAFVYHWEPSATAFWGAFWQRSDGTFLFNGGTNRGTLLIRFYPTISVVPFLYMYNNATIETIRLCEGSGGLIIFNASTSDYWSSDIKIGMTVDFISFSYPWSTNTQPFRFIGAGQLSNGTIVVVLRAGSSYGILYSANNGASWTWQSWSTYEPLGAIINNDIIYFSTTDGRICSVSIGGSPTVLASNINPPVLDFVRL